MVSIEKQSSTQVQRTLTSIGRLLALCLLLGACAVTGSRPVPNTELLEDMQVILDEAEQGYDTVYEPQAQQVLDNLVPGLSISDDLLVPVEERFNISANEEPAREFFNNLVAGTDFGVLVSPGVGGNISISLPNVTIDEVMNAVEDTYGYMVTRSGNIYQIQEATEQTRIFTIDYLDVQRAGSSNVTVTSASSNSSGGGGSQGGVGGGSGGSGSGGSGGVGGNVGGSSGSSGGGGGGGGGQVSTQTATDFWEDITATLASMVGGNGSVIAQPQVGMIMVTALPQDLDRVADYIAQAQGILSREVTVQVQFLEVILNKGFQSAIDFDTFGSGETALTTDNEVFTQFSSGGDLTIDAISNPLAIATNFTDFSAVFRLLESRGTTQVLSSPSLKVLNNQKAVFQDGDQEYFQTSSGSNVVSTGDTVSQSSSNELTPFFSGISMDITPQISASGTITLHVHPTITTVVEQTKTIAGQQVPLPSSTVRELDSVIRAEDGKIVILGGLAYERAVDEVAGIPYAANLPGIGAAFDQRRRTMVKSEFIILLRPVIGNPQSEQNLIRDSGDRLSDINRDLDPFTAR